MPLSLVALKLLALFAAPDASAFAQALATPEPHTCRWSFPGGSPATSTSCSPPPVRFSTPGAKSVTLTVCSSNPHGPCSTVTKPLAILDPRPALTRLQVDPAEPYIGDRLHLTATAAGKPPFTWLWTLPGAATATANPAVLETARLTPGLFAVKLRAANVFGAASRTFYLRLQNPKPVLTGLSLSTTTPGIGSVLAASPNLTGQPPFSFLWALDGFRLGTERTLAWEVIGVLPGPHTLALRVANSSGSASLSRTVTVQQPVILDFRPVCPNLICLFMVGTSVSFNLYLTPSAQPLRFEYDWLGTGTFTEVSPAPVSRHTYTQPGNYRPRVRVTTAAGTEVHGASQFLLVALGSS
jgi:PKD domain